MRDARDAGSGMASVGRGAVLALASAVALALNACGGRASAPPEQLRFHPERPAAAYSSTQVCALPSGDGGARIRGQDGGTSGVAGGRDYWTFGDTLTDDPSHVPSNTIATSDDFDARDCIGMTYKRDGDGYPARLLDTEPGETVVWAAAGEVATDEHTVYFLYNSVASADIPTGTFHFLGIGLGKFDTGDLVGHRVIDHLITDEDLGGGWLSLTPGTDVLIDHGYVYIYFAVGFNVRVGRVPVAQIEDKAAYRYWDGRDWVQEASKSVDILQTAGGQQAFNVAWNPYLGKWTAAYSTDTLNAPAMAYADAPQGPFVDETVLFDCKSQFEGVAPERLVYPEYVGRYACYHVTQHPELDEGDRQTIYLTYANLWTYRLYLQKVVLAAPFAQWDDGKGRAVYARVGEDVAGATKRGVAFYVPTLPGDGLTAIHDWHEASTGRHLYEAGSPGDGFEDRGVAFYASTQPAAGLEPVYRWEQEGHRERTRYSTFDLSAIGYRKAGVSFYAKTLDDQQPFDPLGYVYWVHVKGETDIGCCDSTNNPTHQTTEAQKFVLSVPPDPRGYEAEVCSPVCGTNGHVVWSEPVEFTPNEQGGVVMISPNGPSPP